MQNTGKIRVAIIGAQGSMGSQAVQAVNAADDLQLVAALGRSENLAQTLREADVQVAVDLTHPSAVFANTQAILQANAHAVVGTTGLSAEQKQQLHTLALQQQCAILVAPNFSMGALLLMKFAQRATQYFTHAEIVELHHNQKADAPSGTSLKTAALMQEAATQAFGHSNGNEAETLPGARGATHTSGIHIHSVRLPGLLAHEEVLLGAPGELLTLRHDSFNRQCFMPGILLSIRKLIHAPYGLTDGLEHFLDV